MLFAKIIRWYWCLWVTHGAVPRQVLKIIVSLAQILSIDAAVSIMKAARRYLLFIGN